MPPHCNLTSGVFKMCCLLRHDFNRLSPSYIYMTYKKTAWEMLEAKKHNETPHISKKRSSQVFPVTSA